MTERWNTFIKSMGDFFTFHQNKDVHHYIINVSGLDSSQIEYIERELNFDFVTAYWRYYDDNSGRFEVFSAGTMLHLQKTFLTLYMNVSNGELSND